MNKRIEELAEQAFFETEYDDTQNLPETMQRFAELIVQDICKTLDEFGGEWIEAGQNPPPGQKQNASYFTFAGFRLKEDAISRITDCYEVEYESKHFGVE